MQKLFLIFMCLYAFFKFLWQLTLLLLVERERKKKEKNLIQEPEIINNFFFIYLRISLSICRLVCLSICLTNYLSIYLSIYCICAPTILSFIPPLRPEHLNNACQQKANIDT